MMSNPVLTRKFYIKTYGCQMNFSESEIISGILLSHGYETTEEMPEADVIILNTCAIRDTATNKVVGKLGELKKLKETRPEVIIGIGGCFAQSDSEFLKSKAKFLDFIFGTYNKYKLPEIVNKILEQRKYDDYETILDVGVYPDTEQFKFNSVDYSNSVTAWIPIMRGCDNYCAYCIVPYVRGRELSRDPDDIITQVIELANQGYKEIILLGQNVNSYGKRFGEESNRRLNFPGLLTELSQIEKIKRIRFVTSHPKDFTDDLIRVMAENERICNSLHLPVQSGSDNVLKLMNRIYTRDGYLTLVDKLRENIPGISLATDMIVGFPGETEEDFQASVDLLKRVRYEQAYLFRFSTRPGTAAENLPGHLDEAEKKRRLWELMDVQDSITAEQSSKYLGRIEHVLVEGEDVKKNEGNFTGRTESNKIVVFQGQESDIGNLIKVKITRTTPYTLFGEKL